MAADAWRSSSYSNPSGNCVQAGGVNPDALTAALGAYLDALAEVFPPDSPLRMDRPADPPTPR